MFSVSLSLFCLLLICLIALLAFGLSMKAGLAAAQSSKTESHVGGEPLGKGTPAEFIQALGANSTRVLALKPGEKAELPK